MKFGSFDDASREYVIDTPKTPLPWINYLGSESFFTIISNTGGGYSFYKDARMRRITRYRYNNIPLDGGGKYFYINDGGDVWTPGWMPVKKELDSYECRHGLGYTKITGERNGISTSVLSFVPIGKECEVQQLTVTNTSDVEKTFKVFSFVEFCLWNALDDMTNFQRNLSIGEVEIIDACIYHKTEYRERRNHYSFYSTNADICGFDTDRDTFMGAYGDFGDAAVPFAGQSGNSVASGWSPIASHCLEITLAPGESKEAVFVLGYVENDDDKKWEAQDIINKEKAVALQEELFTEGAVAKAMQELKEYWDELLAKYELDTQDENINRLVNIWNAYQVMVTFNLSRSASYFESGIGRGMGFRDSNQDLLGFVHMIPERARERIIDIASTQFEDGGCYHQYQPLTKEGNFELGGGFNDDPLWMIASTAAYIKETGDWAILDEEAAFECNWDNTSSLFEHLKLSFYHVVNNKGPHGLPLIGRADWNDCLNLNCFSTTPGDSFQTCGNKDGRVAESILIAGMFCYYGPQFEEICRCLGKTEEADAAKAEIEAMKAAILEHGWDGNWYLRAYDDAGSKIGSKECEEGKIFIESQGFCSMAAVGMEDGCVEKSLDAVAEHLETDYGVVLQQPAYSKYYLNLGEISSYPPGYKENAGIFCHNNPWIIIAETVLGRGDRAYNLYSKVAPSFLEDKSEIHRTEPYVFSQMVAGKDAVNHGEAKNAWLTGTAAWGYITATQHILGIQPDFNGLKVDPCIPSTWEGFKVSRKFRDADYEIKVSNPDHVCKGVAKLIVDGEEIDGNIIPIFSDSKVHNVEVILG